MIKKSLALLVVVLSIITTSFCQQIVRRPFLGAKLSTVNDSILNIHSLKNGVKVLEITEPWCSKYHKLKSGDIIISVNNQPTTSSRELGNLIKTKRSGEAIEFKVYRNNKIRTLKGKLPAKPLETSETHDIIYDQFSFNQGQIRVIVDKPRTNKKTPAILFIQGYTCSSLDKAGDNHPYIKLVKGLCEKGYTVMRMEKPGMGDNYNTDSCNEIDFHTEVESFALALEKLKSYDFVDKENVFIWGHSMGGIIAPIIASQQQVKGVIVYGTTILPWRDYIYNMLRVQPLLMDADPVENEQNMKTYAKLLYSLFIDKKNPEELSAQDTTMSKLLNEGFGYDGNGHIWTRNYKYIVQIDDYNMFDVWSRVKSNVFVFWGDADLEAFSEWDHKKIVDVVNKYNPGKATYYNIKNTTHAFAKVESMKHGIKNRDWNYITTHFNNQVIDESSNWIEKIVSKQK